LQVILVYLLMVCLTTHSIAPTIKCRMIWWLCIMYNELKRMWKEAVMA
jgi:hypothetical protein